MTDGLVDLGPIFSAASALVASYGGYLAVIVGVYLALFVIGLVIEAVRSSKQGGSA